MTVVVNGPPTEDERMHSDRTVKTVTDEPALARRWLAVGVSREDDSRVAGRAAAGQAVAGRAPALLIVFCTPDHDPAAMLAGIQEVSAGAPLIGCCTSSIISTGGPSRHGVVVTALGGPGFSVATAGAADAASRPRAAGAEVAASAMRVQDRPHQVLLLLTDGLSQYQEEILSGAYDVVGASMPLVGGAASPDLKVLETFQFLDDQVLTDAVVGATIASDAPFGVGLQHGWHTVGKPMIVTSSANGQVRTLDDQPALKAYLRRLGAPIEAYSDPVAFDQFTRTRPIGVRRRSGEEVRNVSSVEHFKEGWLRSSGEIPEGGLIYAMDADEESVLAAATNACRAAVDALDGVEPIGLLAFDCVSRSDLLGETGVKVEVERLVKEAGGTPLAGLYTWGEIARTKAINGFHNHTLVILAVS
jgi:hypothetical protein